MTQSVLVLTLCIMTYQYLIHVSWLTSNWNLLLFSTLEIVLLICKQQRADNRQINRIVNVVGINPDRWYVSGRQSIAGPVNELTAIAEEIKKQHTVRIHHHQQQILWVNMLLLMPTGFTPSLTYLPVEPKNPIEFRASRIPSKEIISRRDARDDDSAFKGVVSFISAYYKS